MYEMIEKANPEIEVKYWAQRTCTSSRRFPHYDSGIPLRGMNEQNQNSDYSQQDPHEHFNDYSIPRDSNNRSKESGIIENERNFK